MLDRAARVGSLAVLAWGALLAGPPPGVAQPARVPDAVLSRNTVPAAGTHSAILKVARFGRYSIRVGSASGTSLQLIDRMAGPGPVDGEAGHRDGRLDLFLERGEYKIVTGGHRAAGGEARLEVHSFLDKSAPRPKRLAEHTPVQAELRDLEQISYWIDIESRRDVSFEAAGRALADLRLWRDGEWLLDVTPEREYVQPKVGQPLFIHRLAATLDRGLYLLTAYGGAPQPWAQESAAHPFYLRSGIPRLGEATRTRYTVSPFGIDRYLVPGKANYLRLELPEAQPLTVGVAILGDAGPFAETWDAQLEITKKSAPPVAEVELASQETILRVVSVRGEEGQPYVFQSFERRLRYAFHGSGEYWISTIHGGHPTDSVDATAILVDWPESHRVQPMLQAGIELTSTTGWARRANLLGTLTVFLNVVDAGAYTVASKGTAARFRIEPFMVTPPKGYKPPPFREGGGRWDLDAGLHELTVEPVRKGIMDVAIKPAGLLEDLLERIGKSGTPQAAPVKADVRFPKVKLLRDHSYTLFLNRQPGVASGVVLRALPLDLTEPLPLVLRPGESESLVFRAAEAGTLTAIREDGARLPLVVDAGESAEAARVVPGEHTVTLRGGGPETAIVSLALLPDRLDPKAPLPDLPDTALARIPKLPVVSESQPSFFDLDRSASATFDVKAAEAGLYRLETTGLLSLEGNLRTRTVTSFANAKENGAGRNALLQQYLREGDYQMTVTALGRSAGHGGLVLSRSTPPSGGFLTSGVPARASLGPGEAVSYRFNITKPGRFRLRAIGLGRTLRCRLEDTDGWPIVTPDIEADITRDFAPGRYRLVVLPERTDARVLTVIEPVRQARRLRGHGPHRLALGEKIEHEWLEPAEGAPRSPDAWEWRVPAVVHAQIRLTGEMQGELSRTGMDAEAWTAVASVLPGRGWEGRLEPGRYRLEAVSSRRNNRASYEVGLVTTELVAGQDRDVTAPADIEVAVGEAALAELGSFGGADVKARLFDPNGRLIAESDDRPDDWNFLVVRNLDAGLYRLRVEAVGEESAATRVSFRVPRDQEQPALAAPAAVDAALGRSPWVYSLKVPAGAEMLFVQASSASNVGIALEAREAGGWQAVASSLGRRLRLAVPLRTEPSEYRLRAWSLDRRESNVRLEVSAPAVSVATEAQLQKGLALAGGAGTAGAAARITLARPGVFRAGDGAAPLWCFARGQACTEPDGDLLAVPERELWVVAETPSGAPAGTARAQRVRLGAADRLTVKVWPERMVSCDLAESDGALMLTASSQVGTPGVRALESGGAAGPAGASMAVGAHRAVSVAMTGRDVTGLLWAAAHAGEPFEVTLSARGYRVSNQGKIPAGRWDGTLEAGQASRFELPRGLKRLRLALGEGIVATFQDGDGRLQSIHSQERRTSVESLETEASHVALFATGGATALVTIETMPLPRGGADAPLSVGLPHERAHAEAGLLRLQVASPGTPATLHVRGTSEDAVFVGADGRVIRGRDMAISSGGTLHVPHGPGWVLSWLDREGEEGTAVWGGLEKLGDVQADPPALLALAGAAQLVKLESERPRMLHLRSASALVTRLTRGSAAPEVEVHAPATVYDAYLPGGRSTLAFRMLGGGPLSGTAEITSTEVTPIGDGVGPEALLAPGSARLFSFKVEREGPVGIGVRASAEVVETALLSERGERIAQGAAQMPALQPGTYLVSLRTPPDAPPVTARPVIVGLTPPDTGPPEDVVQKYVAPEAGAEFTSTRAEESRPDRSWRDAYRTGNESTEAEPEPAYESGEGEYGAEGEAEGEGEMSEEPSGEAGL